MPGSPICLGLRESPLGERLESRDLDDTVRSFERVDFTFSGEALFCYKEQKLTLA